MFLSGPILVMKAQNDLLTGTVHEDDEPNNEGAWVLTFFTRYFFCHSLWVYSITPKLISV